MESSFVSRQVSGGVSYKVLELPVRIDEILKELSKEEKVIVPAPQEVERPMPKLSQKDGENEKFELQDQGSGPFVVPQWANSGPIKRFRDFAETSDKEEDQG